jgi:FkbM family methyltransferase
MENSIEVFENEIERYFSDGGDSSLRYNYGLNSDSIVFDVGGYLGDFANEIYERFGSNIYIFEPVKSYYNICHNRFLKNDKVSVISLGISGKTGKSPIYINGDMTSSNIESRVKRIIKTTTLDRAMKDCKVERIDLLKLNIEGDEYNLLDVAIKDKCIERINNIQVQYHLNVNNCEARKEKITKELQKTHTLEWKYDWVWESWKIK